VDIRAEVRDFLRTRRAKITPQSVGLPSDGQRRVPGLRRSEVATLAGVSIEYYSKLERGYLSGVSGSVLDAIARALQLDTAEREHLYDLAQAADGSATRSRGRRRSDQQWVPRPSLQWVLDAMRDAPAIVTNGRSDLLLTNDLSRAMYSQVLAAPAGTPNFARFTFLDEASRRFYPDWDFFADITVATLRTEAGRNPHDQLLHELVGELSTLSEEFRTRWSAHDVRIHTTGTKHFRHEVVGDLVLSYETVPLISEPGLTMTVYAAEPGSSSQQSLRLLASWSTDQASAGTTSGAPAGRPIAQR
jgi:hypothetical protein